MSLVEVTLALSILAVCLGGVLATLMQSRGLTEGSVSPDSAPAMVQGYREQRKNRELKDLVNATKDPASSGLFYDFYDRSIMIRGQSNEQGSMIRQAVNTYNFTVSPAADLDPGIP